MYLELHAIQNFAPSNLNRSDTGSPKDCDFGGYRRARISSQCFKRAMRELFKNGELITPEQKDLLARRTLLLLDEIVKKLKEKNKPDDLARRAVEIALNAANLSVKENGDTKYLIFIGQAEIAALANLCINRWDQLMAVDKAYEDARGLQEQIKTMEAANKSGTKEEKQKAKDSIRDLKVKLKDAQEAAKKAIPKDIKDEVLPLLDGGKAADLALFGRMLADLPVKNVDAACQVAHAISTHKSGIEFDFYTAIDDLKPKSEPGAGMMGTIEFNSACFYRYANVNLDQLRSNLYEDEKLIDAALEAFIHAFICAVPTGKQNSMAAQNPPSFVFAVVRKSSLWSLVNAFTKPVRPNQQNDLVEASIAALDTYWGDLLSMYGSKNILTASIATISSNGLNNLEKYLVKPELVKSEDGKTKIDCLIDEVKKGVNANRS